MSVWKSDETLLSICILNFSFKNDFVWEEISNIRHSVSSPDETPRSSSKILRCASYFQLSSRCFIWWWNTASHVWYITSRITEMKDQQICNIISSRVILSPGYRRYCGSFLWKWMKNNLFLDTSFLFIKRNIILIRSRILVKRNTLKVLNILWVI